MGMQWGLKLEFVSNGNILREASEFRSWEWQHWHEDFSLKTRLILL